jgi:hypothetical protein
MAERVGLQRSTEWLFCHGSEGKATGFGARMALPRETREGIREVVASPFASSLGHKIANRD